MIQRFLFTSALALIAACAPAPTTPADPEENIATLENADQILARFQATVPPLSPDWKGVSKWTPRRGSLEQIEATLLAQDRRGGSQSVWAQLGQIYTEVEEYDRALWYLCKALKADPTDIESWLRLGQHRLGLSKPSEALILMDRVAELNPDHPVGWVCRGVAYSELDELELAEEAFQEAVLLSPRIFTAQLGLARVYETWEQWELAREHLERAMRVDEDHPTALFRLGRVLRELDLEEEAAEVQVRYERAAILEDKRLRTSGLSSSAKYSIVADSYLADGRVPEAVREFQLARASARDDKDRVDALAGLLRCSHAGAQQLDTTSLIADLRALAPKHELLTP